MKKTLSFVLVAAMLLCMIPAFGIFAADVVEIDSAEDFLAIEDNLSGNYKLTADITLTEGLSYKEEGKWFTGTFDGDGHTITLKVKDTDWQRTGVFCTVGACTIKNLTVKGTMESSGNSTSALVGTVKGDGSVVTIENVTTNVNYKADNATNGQGAIIGAVEDKPVVKLINCVNKGDIIGEVVGGLIGAVVGDATIEITGCTNEGDITCTNFFGDYRGAGGFIGKVQNNGAVVTLKDSTNKGKITAQYVVANAYVGHNNSTTYTVENTTNSGKVVSGGYTLPANLAVARDAGIWGSANFDYNVDEWKLYGTASFHATPDMSSYTAYICGKKATNKVTVTDKGDRNVEIVADCTGIADGYASVTIVWADGKYSTFGEGSGVPALKDVEAANTSAELLAKQEEAAVDAGSVSAENPLLKDGWETNPTPHGSEGNLFDADAGNKYEGWHVKGTGPVVIKFQLAEATKVGFYALGTGNDDASFPDRQPVDWKLWASVDGNEYVVIDEQKGADQPNLNNKLIAYDAETDVAYKYFKLEVSAFASEANKADGEGSYVQIGQIKIYKACDHSWGEPVADEGSCTKDATSTVTCDKCGKSEVTVVTEAPGHTFEDGVCSVCGAKENVPETGDFMVVAVMLSVIALAGVAVVSKKRIAC